MSNDHSGGMSGIAVDQPVRDSLGADEERRHDAAQDVAAIEDARFDGGVLFKRVTGYQQRRRPGCFLSVHRCEQRLSDERCNPLQQHRARYAVMKITRRRIMVDERGQSASLPR